MAWIFGLTVFTLWLALNIGVKVSSPYPTPVSLLQAVLVVALPFATLLGSCVFGLVRVVESPARVSRHRWVRVLLGISLGIGLWVITITKMFPAFTLAARYPFFEFHSFIDIAAWIFVWILVALVLGLFSGTGFGMCLTPEPCRQSR